MRRLKTFVFLAAGLVALPMSVRAASNRIFMSTNGNNANDCANPLTPCLTFAGALAQVNPGGEVIAEATGGYGVLNITQAVTISGPPGVVIYSGLSVTVNAPGANVVLRGLTIDGTGASGNGINVQAVAALHIENCVIQGFTGASTLGNGLAVAVVGDCDVRIEDTIIRDNANTGVLVDLNNTGTTRVTINRCRILANFRGITGNTGSQFAVRDSDLSYNTQAGVDLFTASQMWIENCLVTYNQFGIIGSGSTSIIRVAGSTIAGNGTGLKNGSGTLSTRGNNTLIDNTTPTTGTITTFSPF